MIQRSVHEHALGQITDETPPEERDQLEYMANLRILIAGFDQNTLPHLAAQLTYHLGEVLYAKYFWAVHRFELAALILGAATLSIGLRPFVHSSIRRLLVTELTPNIPHR
ncbi:MAG: hypothetical protein AABM30_03435 [Actinomycetota bacterium]